MTIQERNELVEKYLPLVEKVVNRVMVAGVPSYIEREDMIQEASLRLPENIAAHNGRSGASLETFLWRAVRNDVLDYIKSERSHWGNFSDGAPQRKLADIGTVGVRPRKGARSLGLDLRRALKGLTPKQRNAVLNCAIHGFTEREAAKKFGCSQQAIQKRMKAAHKKLRKILTP